MIHERSGKSSPGCRTATQGLTGPSLTFALSCVNEILTWRQTLILGWLGTTSLVAFLAWGCDKWQARRQSRRVAEAVLLGLSAAGGWPGGLAGMLLFRHKTAQAAFQLKFAGAFLVWMLLVWIALAQGGAR